MNLSIPFQSLDIGEGRSGWQRGRGSTGTELGCDRKELYSKDPPGKKSHLQKTGFA